ncbi:MAG TPA: SprT family zinc-dependent metalloprotease [Bacillota bacterium]|nr:M48 family metallopeptidase [Bacillota bacterium]HOA14821.1 SprT family zinc-dependent metalloprotease [Bacillota bacterium]HOG53605.1 SprT family zinc-dependent metalloprotease [Bacillota bacterium]
MVCARKARLITIDDRSGGLEVHLSYRRSRSTVIRVTRAGRVRMGVPYWMPDSEIEGILRLKLPWIRSTVARAEEMNRRLAPLAGGSGDPEPMQLLGRPVKVNVIESQMPGCRLEGDVLVVCVKGASDWQTAARLVDEWCKDLALELAEGCLERYWPYFGSRGYQRPKLRVRAMKTRWGSYSRRTNSISLNASLVKAPPELMEYVVAHELTHLMHMDHSAGFHGALAGLMPDWRVRSRELRAWAAGRAQGRTS